MFEKYLVIFDMDGVLADTGPIHFQSWVKMANEDAGVNFTKEFFEESFGKQSIPITRKLVGTNVEQALVEKWANLKDKYFGILCVIELLDISRSGPLSTIL